MQLLKAYIKIVGIPLPILINTGVSVCIISGDLIKKLKLKIEANDETKMASLEGGSKIKVMDLILNVSIVV